MMTIENDILTRIGGYGLFQKRIIFVLHASTLFYAACMFLSSVFVIYTPPHRCYTPELDDPKNDTNKAASSFISPSDLQPNDSLFDFIPTEYGVDGELQWSQCYMYNQSNILENGSSSNNIVKCDRGWKYFVAPNVATATMEFNLVCDKSWYATLVTLFLMLGMMCGSLVGGLFTDRYGRRLALLIEMTVITVNTCVLAVTPVWIALQVATFCQGFLVVAHGASCVILISEITPNKYRYAVAMQNCVSGSLSFVIMPLLAYLLPNWRHLVAANVALQLIALILSFIYLEESIRWLLNNGKVDIAKNTLMKAAKINQTKLDETEMLECTKVNELQADTTNQKKKPTASSKTTLSYFDLIKLSFLRKRVLILSTAWFSMTLSYFGLSLNTNNLSGDRYLNFFAVAVADLPGLLFSYLTIRKMGCRVTFMLFNSLSGIFLLLTPCLRDLSTTLVLVCNFTGKTFACGCMSLLYLYTGDLFPTLLRSQSYGVCSFVARFSGLLVPFLLYLGTRFHFAIPYSIMGAVAFVAAAGVYFLPETKSQPLPDSLEDAKSLNRFSAKPLCCKRHEESRNMPEP